MTAEAHSWVRVPANSDFPLENLPYGVFETADRDARIGVAIGESILDLRAASETGLLDENEVLSGATLNPLLAAGRGTWTRLRERLTQLLRSDNAEIRDRGLERVIVDQGSSQMLLPFAVGDYVDFYSSLEHASNLGKILRPGSDPLLPNWRWLPVAYHGRSSTIVVDGTPVVRPSGQSKTAGSERPSFGPTASLDIELEVGFVTGPGNRMGEPIAASQAREHIFGLVLVNDWSARDIQAWEYQPLGPFLGKSFATSISPWVVTLDALEPYRVAGPVQEPAPLDYLQIRQPCNYDIALEVRLQSERMSAERIAAVTIARSNFQYMYWSMEQQLAHATVNGTAVRPGDLYASGTISGSTPESVGSLIELTWRGAKPITLPNGEKRAFLEDGDTISLEGHCERPGLPRIGFGAVRGTILPAKR
ncbi:MAG: fumarylacetoacetase [Candidatus Eremiobacteraeota bacterium]|nr:fumarylacetoacetase [Candidatus Eremiobacteraeota bacterium]